MPNMGIQDAPPSKTSLADALFAATRQRLIGLLFGQAGRTFYATELIGLTRSGSGAVQRELASLAQSGLVTVRAIGNQKHYQANPDSPIFEELCGIARKTIGLADPLREALAPLAEKISAAFVYGSVAKRTLPPFWRRTPALRARQRIFRFSIEGNYRQSSKAGQGFEKARP